MKCHLAFPEICDRLSVALPAKIPLSTPQRQHSVDGVIRNMWRRHFVPCPMPDTVVVMIDPLTPGPDRMDRGRDTSENQTSGGSSLIGAVGGSAEGDSNMF